MGGGYFTIRSLMPQEATPMTRSPTLSLATLLLATTLLVPANAEASTPPTFVDACSLAAVFPQAAESCAEAANDAIAATAACTFALGAASAPAAGWLLVGVATSLCIQAMFGIEDAAEACGVTDSGSSSDAVLPDELERAKNDVMDALEELGVVIAL